MSSTRSKSAVRTAPGPRARVGLVAAASALALGGVLLLAPAAASAQSDRDAGPATARGVAGPYGDDMLVAGEDGTEVVRSDGDRLVEGARGAAADRSYGDDGLIAPSEAAGR